MSRKTRMMRVPNDFYDCVGEISKKEGVSKTKFLKTNGVRIIKNSDALTDMLGSLLGRKKRK